MQGKEDTQVLVVDDNRINRRVASAMLGRLGYERIAEAEDGQQALTLVQQYHYPLVLMDCQMPLLDGYATTRAIRQWEAEQALPPCRIIAITAKVLDGDEQRCLQAGMDGYLSKPLQYEALGAMLARPSHSVADQMVDVDADAKPGEMLAADELIDEERLHTLAMLLKARIHDFYHDYFSRSEEMLEQIRSEPRMKADTQAMLIHTIKGSAANVGAQALYLLAAQLEEQLLSGQLPALRDATPVLEAAMAGFHGAMRARLEQF